MLSDTADVRPGNDSPEAKRAADSVRTQLSAIPGGVAGLVGGALDALSMGYAVGELVFADDGTLYIANRGIIPGACEVVSFQSVPEPAVTGAASALGLIGLVWWRRRAARRPNESAQFDLIEDRSAVRNVR